MIYWTVGEPREIRLIRLRADTIPECRSEVDRRPDITLQCLILLQLQVILLMGWDNNTSKSSLLPNVYKNEQEIRATWFYGRFYLLPRPYCNSRVRLELSVMLSQAQNQNKKGDLDQPDTRQHWA